MKIIVTGAAGFIGFHLVKKLLRKKIEVIGIDNLNDYYDKKIKQKRLNILKKNFSSRIYFEVQRHNEVDEKNFESYIFNRKSKRVYRR